MANKIEQAYEQSLRIRRKHWRKEDWIKKISETKSTSDTLYTFGRSWDFTTHPEFWEIYHEDIHLFEETPDNLPETLIINGIKYKRDDN